MKQILTIPGQLPDLNTYIRVERGNSRTAKFAAATLKKKTERTILKHIQRCGIKPVTRYPVTLTYYWICPHRRKDKRNVAYAAKFVEDALQAGGRPIIKNDGWNDLNDPDDHFDIDATNPRVVVVIDDHQDD